MRTLLAALLCAATAAAQSTAVFPGAVATDAHLGQSRNAVSTTLTASMAVGTTTMTVADGSRIVANMALSIGSATNPEVVWTCLVAGNTITLGRSACPAADGRGFDGTTATTHLSNERVRNLVISHDTNVVKAEIKAIEGFLSGASSTSLNASLYDWTQSITATVSAGANSITLAPCPLGVDGANTSYYIDLSGGTGSPARESVLVTGGTCTSAAASGTLTFVATTIRTGTWTAASASAGIGEAAWTLPDGGAVLVPAGTYTFYQTLSIPYGKTEIIGAGERGSVVIRPVDGAAFHNLVEIVVNDAALVNVEFDGNLATSAVSYQRGILVSVASDTRIENCVFRNWGYQGAPVFAAGYYDSGAILCYKCTRPRITNNLFESNWVADIVGNLAGDGAVITGNQHGNPNLTKSNTPTLFWDNKSGGMAAVFWQTGDNVKITGNQIWGTQRYYTPSTQYGNPIVTFSVTNALIEGNTITGMSNLAGTCSVTVNDPTITCSKPVFSATYDVGAGIECETKVGTIYTIQSVDSTTKVTLTGNYLGTTLGNARCRLQQSGDLIQTNGMRHSRIVNNSTVRSGDMGIDVNMGGAVGSEVIAWGNTVSGNTSSDNMACGVILSLGQIQSNSISTNILSNNNRGGGSAGGRGGICLGATPDNVNYYVISGNSFTDNLCENSASTQSFCVDVDPGSYSGGWIGGNHFSNNRIYNSAFSNVPITQSQPPSTPLSAGVAAGPLLSSVSISTDATAGVRTYAASAMVNGILLRDPGGNVSDVTATAAQLFAVVSQPILGTSFEFHLRNNAAGAHTVTVTGGANVTISGTATVPQNEQRRFVCQFTDATPTAPTITCYSMGSAAY